MLEINKILSSRSLKHLKYFQIFDRLINKFKLDDDLKNFVKFFIGIYDKNSLYMCSEKILSILQFNFYKSTICFKLSNSEKELYKRCKTSQNFCETCCQKFQAKDENCLFKCKKNYSIPFFMKKADKTFQKN